MQKQAILEAVNAYLTVQNCDAALTQVLPVYGSPNTDNPFRMATSKSYGCVANISFFKVLGDLVSFSGNLGGSGLWEFMAQEFPSTLTPIEDKVLIAAERSLDAAMSAVKPGLILVPSMTVSPNTFNPISLSVDDRITDANSFLTIVGMALMGSLLNRYGEPLPNFHKTQALPWTTATTVTADGCAFASGLLNFYDGLQAVIASAPASVASRFGTIQTLLGTVITAGCTTACLFTSGCAADKCTGCPLSLRHRDSCRFLVTDVNSCAAAGLTFTVNSSWSGPP